MEQPEPEVGQVWIDTDGDEVLLTRCETNGDFCGVHFPRGTSSRFLDWGRKWRPSDLDRLASNGGADSFTYALKQAICESQEETIHHICKD